MTAVDPQQLPALPDDLRLVAVDMDGTLLDAEQRVPEQTWALLDGLAARGVVVAPASGRQYATLARLFGDHGDGMVFVAENGAYVVRGGAEVTSTTVPREAVAAATRLVRDLVADGRDVGLVACGKSSAYVERADDPFLDECRRYYARLEVLDDLLTAEDEWLKIAVFDFGPVAEHTAPALEGVLPDLAVVVSGQHWVDAMHPTTNKGAALRRVQEVLGVTRAQTAAFGDYHNDLELLADADWSFAVANAHPDVRAAARFVVPSNADHGVQQVLAAWLSTH